MRRQRDWIWVGIVLVAVLATYPFVRVSSDAPPSADRSGDGSGKGKSRPRGPQGLTVEGIWPGMEGGEFLSGRSRSIGVENGFVVYPLAGPGPGSSVRVKFRDGLVDVVMGHSLERDGVEIPQPGGPSACERLFGRADHVVHGDGPSGGSGYYTWTNLGLTVTVSSPPTPRPGDWKNDGPTYELSQPGR